MYLHAYGIYAKQRRVFKSIKCIIYESIFWLMTCACMCVHEFMYIHKKCKEKTTEQQFLILLYTKVFSLHYLLNKCTTTCKKKNNKTSNKCHN